MNLNSWTCKIPGIENNASFVLKSHIHDTPDVLVYDKKFLSFRGRKQRLEIGMTPLLSSVALYKELGLWFLLGGPLPSTQGARELFPGHRAYCSTLIFTVGSKGVHGRLMFPLLFTLLSPKQTGVSLVL